jgi:hypothetical protein
MRSGATAWSALVEKISKMRVIPLSEKFPWEGLWKQPFLRTSYEFTRRQNYVIWFFGRCLISIPNIWQHCVFSQEQCRASVNHVVMLLRHENGQLLAHSYPDRWGLSDNIIRVIDVRWNQYVQFFAKSMFVSIRLVWLVMCNIWIIFWEGNTLRQSSEFISLWPQDHLLEKLSQGRGNSIFSFPDKAILLDRKWQSTFLSLSKWPLLELANDFRGDTRILYCAGTFTLDWSKFSRYSKQTMEIFARQSDVTLTGRSKLVRDHFCASQSPLSWSWF